MRFFAVVILALVLVASPAWASWSVKGTNEPDVKRDADEGWMYPQPDTSVVQTIRKVYFNGFVGAYEPVGISPLGQSAAPNVAAVKSGFMPYSYYFQVAFGVWKDCNVDGYVGYGEAGLIEYRSELLILGASVCPAAATPVTPPSNRPPMNWFPSHNDGEWVRELLPISWVRWEAATNGADLNPYNVNDNASRVWADIGLPESVGGTSATCEYTPYGMTRSTGGALRWVDCLAGFRITDNYNTALAAAGGDTLNAGQLSFKDKPREQDQSASVLNQKNPWGKESDSTMVEVWDCSDDPTPIGVDQETLTNGALKGTIHVTNVSTAKVPAPQSGGSLAGTANATGSGFDECSPTSANDGRSHPGQSAAHAPYAPESSQSIGAGLPKTQTGVMMPRETVRPSAASGLAGRAAPNDLGARVSGDDGFWIAPGRTGVALVRADVAKPTQSTYMTFYGYVSPAAISAYGLSLKKGGTADVYGKAACGSIGVGQGVRNGWDCNPTHWWTDVSGADLRPRSTVLAPGLGGLVNVQVGSLYNARDIDCYDFQASPARETGVPNGLNANPCVRP